MLTVERVHKCLGEVWDSRFGVDRRPPHCFYMHATHSSACVIPGANVGGSPGQKIYSFSSCHTHKHTFYILNELKDINILSKYPKTCGISNENYIFLVLKMSTQ